MSIAVLGRVTDFYPFSISLGVRINSAAVQADMLHQLWRRLLQWKQGYLHLVCLCASSQFDLLHALQLFVHTQTFLCGAHMVAEMSTGSVITQSSRS